MRNQSKKGFTLIELLIVIAIIGILAAVLIPNLMRARTVASYRAAEAHTQNVYKAAFAYVAESVENILPNTADCGPGTAYAAGEYTVADPGAVVLTCTVTKDAANMPIVSVTHGYTSVDSDGAIDLP